VNVNVESNDSRFHSEERIRPQATATLPGSTAAQVRCTPAPALRRTLTNNATSSDYLPPRCTPKGQPGRRTEPYEQEGDQHLPLRKSRTSPETIGGSRQPKLSVQPALRQAHPPDVRWSARPCGQADTCTEVVTGQANHESGRSTVSSS